MDHKSKTVHPLAGNSVGQMDRRNDSLIVENPEDGVFIQNLRKGTLIRVATALIQGVGLIIDMEVVTPGAFAVKINRVVNRTGFFQQSIGSEGIGIRTPVVVLRSFVPSDSGQSGGPDEGWIGLNCNLTFSGGVTISQVVREIIVNGRVLFPNTNTTAN